MSWPISADIRSTFTTLFTSRRDRLVVLGLVVLAAVVSLTELVATQLFSVLILPGSERSTTEIVVLVVLFFAVYGGLRLVNFAREMYRINVFERALTQSVGLTPVKDSWRWAMAIEVTTLLSTVGRIVVVTAACTVFAPLFGLGVIVVVALTGVALSVIFRRQLRAQREFRQMQLARKPASNATRVRSRVRAGEIGSLFAYFGIVLLIGLLVALTFLELVPPGTAFVLFVALRMMGQMLTDIAKGLMRYVRARAFSE